MKECSNIKISIQTASCYKEFPGSIIRISVTGREKVAERGRRAGIGPIRRRLVHKCLEQAYK
jgi:hypothetical protein